MRHLRVPNTTFDLYILPNVPPNGPDLSSKGYLHTWFIPGMQNNEGATGRTFLYDSCIDVEEGTDARDDWPTPPASYRIYIPTMLDQGYDVVFVERFRPLGVPDFKRIFLKRRQWSAKKGLITEGGLRLAGSGAQARPISATGGLHLAATASYLTRVAATGGLILGATASETRPTTGAGGINLNGTAHVTRPYVAAGGLHLAGNTQVMRPYTGAGGPHLAGTATHHP